jgi:hypothetical protein
MVTLPSHTSHALQPLDVSCFKPFKIAFKKEKDATMVRNNYTKPNKVTLARWVEQHWTNHYKKKISNLNLGLQGFDQ